MSRLSFGMCVWVMVVAVACGVLPQARAEEAAPVDARLNRQIEIVIRKQFRLPTDWSITFGERKPSKFAGYDEWAVTLTRGERTVPVTFLITPDNKTLARLESFDIAKEAEVKIDLAGRPVRGNAAAPVTVVVYDDLECPVCARTNQELFPAAPDRYGDKVRFIYKDNPLPDIHPWAMRAAVDAECLVDANGKAYWSYVDYVHGHASDITGKDRDLKKSFAALDDLARAKGTDAGVDRQKLDACLEKQDDAAVQASLREARVLGLNFAPAVYVNGERIDGFVPEALMWKVVDRALRAEGVEPPADAPVGPAHAVNQ